MRVFDGAGKFFLGIIILISSCKSAQVPSRVEFRDYEIRRQMPQDSGLLVLIQPYRDSLSRTMNEVIGWSDASLEKVLPSGSLNNFMADAMLYMGRQKFDPSADAAFVNFGGIRLNQLPSGPVTRGKVFELMPFDNALVMQEISGAVLQEFLDLTAAKGGFAVSGITMQIRNKKAVNVMVGGKPLDPASKYRIINSDYIVHGGDDIAVLKDIPYQNKGYLMRDAIAEYIISLKSSGKNITANQEKRVSYAE